MSTTLAQVEMFVDLPAINERTKLFGHKPAELLETAKRNRGICNVSTSALPTGHSWLLCLILTEEVRLLELWSADEKLLGGLNFDLQSWIHGRNHAGIPTTFRDSVAYLADLLHGDKASAVMAKFEAEGKL